MSEGAIRADASDSASLAGGEGALNKQQAPMLLMTGMSSESEVSSSLRAETSVASESVRAQEPEHPITREELDTVLLQLKREIAFTVCVHSAIYSVLTAFQWKFKPRPAGKCWLIQRSECGLTDPCSVPTIAMYGS